MKNKKNIKYVIALLFLLYAPPLLAQDEDAPDDPIPVLIDKQWLVKRLNANKPTDSLYAFLSLEVPNNLKIITNTNRTVARNWCVKNDFSRKKITIIQNHTSTDYVYNKAKSVGTNELHFVLFTGIQTPQPHPEEMILKR